MWRMVISSKKDRKGEAFVLHNNTFVLKVYRVGDAAAFARYLVMLLNAADAPEVQKLLSQTDKGVPHEA